MTWVVLINMKNIRDLSQQGSEKKKTVLNTMLILIPLGENPLDSPKTPLASSNEVGLRRGEVIVNPHNIII